MHARTHMHTHPHICMHALSLSHTQTSTQSCHRNNNLSSYAVPHFHISTDFQRGPISRRRAGNNNISTLYHTSNHCQHKPLRQHTHRGQHHPGCAIWPLVSARWHLPGRCQRDTFGGLLCRDGTKQPVPAVGDHWCSSQVGCGCVVIVC